MSEELNPQEQLSLFSEVDVRSIIEKAINEVTKTASNEASRLAQEAIQKTNESISVKLPDPYDVSGEKGSINQRTFDPYFESRRTTMELEPKPRRIEPARMFNDVDDFWGGPDNVIYPPFWPMIRAVTPISDPPEYELAINHGYVVQSFFESESGTDKLKYAKPTGLESWQSTEAGKFYYVTIHRDGSGMLKSSPAPQITVSNAELPSQSYSRKTGDFAEVDGVYNYLICKTLPPLTSGSPPIIERYHAGDNVVISQERPEAVNLPLVRYPEVNEEYRDVLKNYDEAKDAQQFRSLKQLGSDKGLPIIKPIGESEDPATIETIDFRRIAPRDMGSASGEPQIKIVASDDGKLIHVQGNGYDAEVGGTIVKDGLVVQLGGSEYAGTGSFESKGYEESTPTKHIEWEEGIVKTNGSVTIKDKDVEPQVKVKSAAGTITIEGNGYNAEAGGILVKDGLVAYLNPTGTGGCEDGGTGSISLIEDGASTGVPIAEWIDGCVKTNGNVQIIVKELMVCVDGVPAPVKFLTIAAMPTPPPPPTP